MTYQCGSRSPLDAHHTKSGRSDSVNRISIGNDLLYTPTTCFETFPFPAGLTLLNTAHQRTEKVENGALIPANLLGQRQPSDTSRDRAPGSNAPSNHTSVLDQAIAIAQAAKHLNDLRDNWLNPPEWAHRVPEVIPLGMSTSPYPDRIEPRPDILEADLKALQKRTLTKLYNQRPAWLAMAHQQLDTAVAAYGWTDYSPDMPDDEILKRLLALNLERAAE